MKGKIDYNQQQQQNLFASAINPPITIFPIMKALADCILGNVVSSRIHQVAVGAYKTILPKALCSCLLSYIANMASSQHEQYCSNVDTSTSSVQQQGDRKAGAISFGFSKTLSKFKSSRDEAIDADERDYLTGVDGKELLR